MQSRIVDASATEQAGRRSSNARQAKRENRQKTDRAWNFDPAERHHHMHMSE